MNTFIKIFHSSMFPDVQKAANEYAMNNDLDMVNCSLSHDTNITEFTYEREHNYYLCVIFKHKEK